MPLILAALIIVNVIALAGTTALGVTLDDVDSLRLHLLAGVATTILLVFTHSLVLFYLIGTGMDIREAVEPEEALRERFLPFTRELKRRVFPWACAAAALIIVAALLGADVHSRLISLAIERAGDAANAPDAPMPLREVGGWWVHLALVVVAVAVNGRALWAEFVAARDNRAAILAINHELAALEEASEAASESA